MSTEAKKQLFWPDDLPYNPLLGIKSDGSAWCFAPQQIAANKEFTFRCVMRMNSFKSGQNMFGCHPYIIGTYSWGSSGKCAINNVQNPSGSYWWVTPSEFADFRELKITKVLNAARTYWTYTSHVDGVKQVEGVNIADNSISNIGSNLHWFGVFAESSGTTSNVMRPTDCPTGIDVQSIGLESDGEMKFDMRAALDGDMPCFYDMVAKRHVRSAGTGNFMRVDS